MSTRRIKLGTVQFGRAWLQAIFQAGREQGMMIAFGFLAAITSMCFTDSLALYPMASMTFVSQIILLKAALSLWDCSDADKGRPTLV